MNSTASIFMKVVPLYTWYFLAIVAVILILLVLCLLYLYQVLCFQSCEGRTCIDRYLKPKKRKLQETDSSSDDEDDEITKKDSKQQGPNA